MTEKNTKKKANKKLIAAIGLAMIILSTVCIVFISFYLFLTFTPLGRQFVSSLTEETLVREKKQLVVTQQEFNTISIVEEASPSVVSIAVSRLELSVGEGLINTNSKIGTGFLVKPEGIIVTNQHVVSDTTAEYRVITDDGKEHDVVEIVRDDLNDLAVIKIETKEELTSLKLGDSDTLLVGQSVIAIGTPLGEFAGSVTTGIISGLNRSVTAGTGWFGSSTKTYEDVIQTDAAVNPGNSGGPLLNSQGEVIGINFATTSGADNISFAIPINKIKNRLEEYKTYGKFIKPYLGVTYQMISDLEALYYNNVVPGALILRVEPSSPAYEAGIRSGDILTKFGDTKVDKFFGDLIQQHKVGEEIDVEVFREGKTFNMKVKLAEMD